MHEYGAPIRVFVNDSRSAWPGRRLEIAPVGLRLGAHLRGRSASAQADAWPAARQSQPAYVYFAMDWHEFADQKRQHASRG